VEGCLAWRNTYGDLLGKPREAVIERFGLPQKEYAASLSWDSSSKTGDRDVTFVFDSAMKSSVAGGERVYARRNESLGVLEVLKKAPMFKFDTGTYTDALPNYFTASTIDGRNIFQFDVADGDVRFRSMMFLQK
jgi:hypothetical protein